MKMKNKKMFSNYMTMIGEIFDKAISKPLLEIYWETLKPFLDGECEDAFKKIIATSKFWPKPADFLDILQGNNEEKAVQAWAMVDEAMRKHGNYVSLDFGDPKIHRCIELLGGWDYLGTLTEEEWKWKRKEFKSAYKALPNDQGPEHIAGLIEKDNSVRGYDSGKIITLGPHRKAKRLNKGD
jgi:hypothetical protein